MQFLEYSLINGWHNLKIKRESDCVFATRNPNFLLLLNELMGYTNQCLAEEYTRERKAPALFDFPRYLEHMSVMGTKNLPEPEQRALEGVVNMHNQLHVQFIERKETKAATP